MEEKQILYANIKTSWRQTRGIVRVFEIDDEECGCRYRLWSDCNWMEGDTVRWKGPGEMHFQTREAATKAYQEELMFFIGKVAS